MSASDKLNISGFKYSDSVGIPVSLPSGETRSRTIEQWVNPKTGELLYVASTPHEMRTGGFDGYKRVEALVGSRHADPDDSSQLALSVEFANAKSHREIEEKRRYMEQIFGHTPIENR